MIEVQRACRAPGAPDDAALTGFAEAALAGRGASAGEVVLRLVDAAEGRALNARFRGKDAPTNVLAFGHAVPEETGEALLGDIVLCVPVVAREAREQGKVLADHYAHLVVHGILHLLGHDHRTDDEAEAMERLERDILAALDISDPYTPQPFDRTATDG